MANLLATCPNCGQKIPASIGECMYCPPSASAAARQSQPPSPPQPQPPPAAASAPAGLSPNPFSPAPPPASASAPTAAQLLLVAEECLVRGQPDKAAELARQALAARPDSLEAKGALDRARRQLVRQRRRSRQEQRIKEARALLDAGDAAGAEKIVASVLRLLPGHPDAIALFGRLKERRPSGGDAEAEAERELAGLSRGQVRRAAEAARAAHRAGWDGKAMLALRRGLRLAPDDPALIELLHEIERALGEHDRAAARRRAGNAQVREALEWLKAGRFDDSLKSLRSLLHQDPDHARAQAAVQEVRRQWLARPPAAETASAPSPAPSPAPASVSAAPAPAPRSSPAPTATVAPPAAGPASPRAVPVPPGVLNTVTRFPPLVPRAAGPTAVRPPDPTRHPLTSAPTPRPTTPVPASPPPEIALRPTRSGTPLLLVFGSAALVIGGLLALTSRPSGRKAAVAAVLPVTAPAAPPTTLLVAPLAAADPEIRRAIETTLADYTRALELQDSDLLAQARPDLTAAERERLLAPFRQAVNVEVDLRVLDVIPSRGAVVVSVLREDKIIGGRGGPTAPVEETLRFERRDDVWRLAGSR